MTAQPAGGSTGPMGSTGPTGAGVALAPPAPGRLGEAATPEALRAYLAALGEWRDRRRAELDRLDEASLQATDPDSYTPDITLSMAIWQAVSDRYDLLVSAWDSGRADRIARERMSQLIWGRLDTSGGVGAGSGPAPGAAAASALAAGLSVSLVDACRLSDALAAQLRARLSFDPRAADSALRLSALRAAMERCRELAAHQPGEIGRVQRLQARVDDLTGAASRGGDVAGPLQLLEADAARVERDLIVATATEQALLRDRDRAAADLVRDRVRAMNEVAALEHREQALRELADRCVREIAIAPRLAVPDPEALGPVPTDRPGVDAYLARLATLVRAMDLVEQTYSAPLAERDELRGRLDGYRVMALRTGRAADREVATVGQFAGAALQAVPCDLDAARTLVAQYQNLVRPGRPPESGAK